MSTNYRAQGACAPKQFGPRGADFFWMITRALSGRSRPVFVYELGRFACTARATLVPTSVSLYHLPDFASLARSG